MLSALGNVSAIANNVSTIIPISSIPLLPSNTTEFIETISLWIVDNIWSIDSILTSLWDRLSYFKKKKAGLLTNTPSTNSTMEKHSGSSLRHWSPEKIATLLTSGAIVILLGFLVRSRYKKQLYSQQEKIEKQIMKDYPLKPLEIHQMRKTNYTNVRDIQRFLVVLQAGLKVNRDYDDHYFGHQVRMSCEELQKHFINFFGRPFRDVFLLNEIYRHLDKDNGGRVGLAEWIIVLAMISIGSPTDRVQLAFSAMDRDNDGIITYSELCGFVHVVTSVGWCYAKQTYTQSKTFPPRFRRTTPQEIATLLLQEAGLGESADVTLEVFNEFPFNLV